MFFLEHAKDIWYLVISLCALSVTVFVCFILYYLAHAAKSIHDSFASIKRRIDELDEAIDIFQNKIMHYLSYVTMPTKIIKKVFDFIKGEASDSIFKTKNKHKNRKKEEEGSEFYGEDL